MAATKNNKVPHIGSAMSATPCHGSIGFDARKMSVCPGIETSATPSVQATFGHTRWSDANACATSDREGEYHPCGEPLRAD